MPADTAAVTGPTPAKPKHNKRRARVRIDRRYALGRRVKELETVFRQRLGADAEDVVLSTAIKQACELTALAEAASARALRNDPRVTLDDVVRLQRSAALSVHRLHLDRRAQPATPSLSDYLRQRAET